MRSFKLLWDCCLKLKIQWHSNLFCSPTHGHIEAEVLSVLWKCGAVEAADLKWDSENMMVVSIGLQEEWEVYVFQGESITKSRDRSLYTQGNPKAGKGAQNIDLLMENQNPQIGRELWRPSSPPPLQWTGTPQDVLFEYTYVTLRMSTDV